MKLSRTVLAASAIIALAACSKKPPAELPPADRSPSASLRRAEVTARPLGVREEEPLPSLPP